jgi:hypothetical protein
LASLDAWLALAEEVLAEQEAEHRRRVGDPADGPDGPGATGMGRE